MERLDKIKNLMAYADDVAIKYSQDGKIIGRVTRFYYVKVGNKPLIRIDIPFENYVERPVKMGEYIAVVSIVPKAIILGIVDEIDRADALANLGIKTIKSSEDPSTMATDASIILRPLGEIRFDVKDKVIMFEKVTPSVSPIDPQSPVFIPKPEIIYTVFGIPPRGVSIGNIISAFEPTEVEVNFDTKLLRHHLLIIGTTGAGKTTLLKTLFYMNYRAGNQSIVVDRQGDFVKFMMKFFNDGDVILPVTQRIAEEYKNDFKELVSSRYCSNSAYEYDKSIIACEPKEGKLIKFYLFSLKFSEAFKELPNLFPYMSDQAMAYWNMIVERANKLKVDFNQPFNNVINTLNRSVIAPITSNELAPSTKQSIERVINGLASYGIFDVNGTIKDDRLFDILTHSSNIVIDLSFVLESTALVEPISILAYKILDILYDYKDRQYKTSPNPDQIQHTLLIIDEAHELFPQVRQEASKETVEALVNRILRLGRQRNLGVALATHVPKDLNPLVLQLTNTKIIMRNDENVLKDLGVEEYADVLEYALPGTGLVKSSFFNNSEFLIKVKNIESE